MKIAQKYTNPINNHWSLGFVAGLAVSNGWVDSDKPRLVVQNMLTKKSTASFLKKSISMHTRSSN